MTRGTFVFLASFGIAAPASAGDAVFPNKGMKIYPKSEARYIKQFAGPTVSPCGPCFGFYKTQWRSWGEACNEPQPADPGPVKYAPPPEDAIPEPEKKGTPAVPKLDAGPKAPEKKDPAVMPPDKKNPSLPMDDKKPEVPKPEEKKPAGPPTIEVPKIDLPQKPLTMTEAAPTVAAGAVEIPVPPVVKLAEPTPVSVPVAPAPMPAVAPLPLPTVIVPISR